MRTSAAPKPANLPVLGRDIKVEIKTVQTASRPIRMVVPDVDQGEARMWIFSVLGVEGGCFSSPGPLLNPALMRHVNAHPSPAKSIFPAPPKKSQSWSTICPLARTPRTPTGVRSGPPRWR